MILNIMEAGKLYIPPELVNIIELYINPYLHGTDANINKQKNICEINRIVWKCEFCGPRYLPLLFEEIKRFQFMTEINKSYYITSFYIHQLNLLFHITNATNFDNKNRIKNMFTEMKLQQNMKYYYDQRRSCFLSFSANHSYDIKQARKREREKRKGTRTVTGSGTRTVTGSGTRIGTRKTT